MTQQELIIAKYRADDITSIKELVRVAFELGKMQGKDEVLDNIPINAISQAKGYQQGYQEGVESVDKDKIALAHLIPKEGLRSWNELTFKERMEKYHMLIDWQKAKIVEI